MRGDDRGVSETVATVLMVAVVLVLASVTAGFVGGLADESQPVAPQVALEHELVADGGEMTIAVTLAAGDAVRTDQLYVSGSKRLDIGGAPDSSTPANDAYASERETFTESSGGNPPQVDIGETWESGETVYLDPAGSATGVTVEVYWNTKPVAGVNPGSVQGEDSYLLAEFTTD
jgi:flagellin-like protein